MTRAPAQNRPADPRHEGAPRVLVLAGLDPSGRAGLLADGEAIRALGAQPVLCATAIAAQSNRRLVAAVPVGRRALEAQIEGAVEDGPVAAVKVGMIGARETLQVLFEQLQGPLAGVPLVVDPVLATSRGGALFEGLPSEMMPLFSQARLITPNLGEAALLAGMPVENEAAMQRAARFLGEKTGAAVLIKGGHLCGEPADLLIEQDVARWFRGQRLDAQKRGTGCRLASGIAAGLAQGWPLDESVESSRQRVVQYLLG